MSSSYTWCNSKQCYTTPITCYRIHILKIPPLNYMFYMFLTFMPIFMLIGCYLPFDSYSSFMHYFKPQKLEFQQLIDDMTINL